MAFCLDCIYAFAVDYLFTGKNYFETLLSLFSESKFIFYKIESKMGVRSLNTMPAIEAAGTRDFYESEFVHPNIIYRET